MCRMLGNAANTSDSRKVGSSVNLPIGSIPSKSRGYGLRVLPHESDLR